MNQLAEKIIIPDGFVSPNRRNSDNFKVRDFADELNSDWAAASPCDCSVYELDFDQYRIVINNGFLVPELSRLPQSITVGNGDLARHDLTAKNRISDALFSLNYANTKSPVQINISSASNVDLPLCVYYLNSENVFSNPRVTVNCAENSKLDLVECYPDSSRFWCNSVLQINLANSASLTHSSVSPIGQESRLMQNTTVNQAEKSNYKSFHMQAFGNWNRLSLHVGLDNGASCSANGLMLGIDKCNQQQQIFIDHNGDNTTSEQSFRALASSARVSFIGRVSAAKGLRAIQAEQKSDHLLLDNNAQSDNQPQMQIFSEDVKCAHGATVGALDPKAIFYLRSRGIEQAQAEFILAKAFAETMLADLPKGLHTDVSFRISSLLASKFRGSDA